MSSVPRSIARYEVQTRLGSGGMGSIYLARDPFIDRLVAIKLLHADLADEDVRRRFAQEARASGALSHPHIVIVHDYGEFEGAPFIVMEYLRGETLAEIVKRRADLPIWQKLRWMEEVCRALGYAHQAGIIHRDIKPSNLMIDQHGTIKVLDFGIARIMGANMTRVTATVGTPGYMSPEQIEGIELDIRSDVFALGAVAYELLCYQPAFPGSTVPAILNKVLREEPARLDSYLGGIDTTLVEVLATALRKDRARRYADMSAFEQALTAVRKDLELRPNDGTVILKGGPLATPPPTPRRRSDPSGIARRRAELIEQHLRDARAAVQAKDVEAIEVACEEVLLLDPVNTEALDLIARTREEPAERVTGVVRDAQAALSRKDFREAERLLAQAQHLAPNDLSVVMLKADLRSLVEANERQLRRSHEIATAYDRARQSFEQGAFDAAQRYVIEALALDPTHVPSLDLQREIALRRQAASKPPAPTGELAETVFDTSVVVPSPRERPPLSIGQVTIMGSAVIVLIAAVIGGRYLASRGQVPDAAPVATASVPQLQPPAPTPPAVPPPSVLPAPSPAPPALATGLGTTPAAGSPPQQPASQPLVASPRENSPASSVSGRAVQGADGAGSKPPEPATPNPAPVDRSAALARAEEAENAGRLDEALAQYEAILRADRRNAGAMRGAARVGAEKRNRAARLVRRAEALFQDADYDGAIRDLNAALAAEPGNKRAADLLRKVQLARSADQKRPPQRDEP